MNDPWIDGLGPHRENLDDRSTASRRVPGFSIALEDGRERLEKDLCIKVQGNPNAE